MNLLLDTHALLWAMGDPARLSMRARRAITSPQNELAVSALSLWEIAIKTQTGKLGVPMSRDYIDDRLEHIGVSRILNVTPAHVYAFLSIPRLHKDPFDRLLAAQCVAENLCLVSRDARLKHYPIEVLW